MASLVLRVIDADGTPVKRAEIYYNWMGRTGRSEWIGDGQLRFDLVSTGWFKAGINADGAPTKHVEIDLGLEADHEHVVRLERGVSARGTIVDDAGAAVPNVGVTIAWKTYGLTDGGSPSYGRVRTDAEGQFVVDGLRPGTHKMWLTADGHVDLYYPTVKVPHSGMSLTLPRATRVSATLSLPTGVEPPAKFQVALRVKGTDVAAARGWRPWASWKWELVDWNDGRLELTKLSAVRYRVRVFVPGCAAFETEAACDEERVIALGDVALAAVAQLAGRVLDQDGAPIADALVSVRHDEIHVRAMDNAYDSARTDSDGRFELSLPLRESVHVTATAPGCAPVTVITTPVARGAPVEIRLASGVRIRWRLPCWSRLLRRWRHTDRRGPGSAPGYLNGSPPVSGDQPRWPLRELGSEACSALMRPLL